MSRFLADALAYAARGWSIIPIRRGKTKPPACRSWKSYQRRPPVEADLHRWFGKTNPRIVGLAVICGSVSGELVCRDYDVQAAYDRWAADFPDLARTLPTVKTVRGAHVYFRDPETTRITDEGDGELRGSGYCVLPPSIHPDGSIYEWVNPLPPGPLPIIKPAESGLVTSRRATEDNGAIKGAGGKGTFCSPLCSSVAQFPLCSSVAQFPLCSSVAQLPLFSSVALERIITETLPTGRRQRNNLVFRLCRRLKGIPELANANLETLKPIVRRWHERARPYIGTKDWGTTWFDFVHAWNRVTIPVSDDWMKTLLKRTQAEPEPEAAREYEHPGIRLLTTICAILQRDAGDRPFFLSCRSAGELLGVDHGTASRWLAGLVVDRVLTEVVKGDATSRRATRYLFNDPHSGRSD